MPVRAKQLVAWHACEDVSHDLVRGAPIAVADRLFCELPARVHEAIVNAPAVHAARDDVHLHVGGDRACQAKAGVHSLEETRHVPPQVPINSARRVREAVHLVQLEPVRPEAAEHGATAARAQIDGEVKPGTGHYIPTRCTSHGSGFRVLGSRLGSAFLVRSRFSGFNGSGFLGSEFQVRRRLDWSAGDIRNPALGTRNP